MVNYKSGQIYNKIFTDIVPVSITKRAKNVCLQWDGVFVTPLQGKR